MAVHAAGKSMSNASKGYEREGFVNNFLPPLYRFGTGDATDENGHKAGSLMS